MVISHSFVRFWRRVCCAKGRGTVGRDSEEHRCLREYDRAFDAKNAEAERRRVE